MSLVIPPEVIEGDYTTYTEVRNTAGLATALDNPAHGSCFNKLETMLIYVDVAGTVALIRVSDAVIIDEDANYARGVTANQYASKSAFGTYMASISDEENALRIWKNGVLIQSEIRTDINDDWFGAIVSPSGRYIAVPWWDNSAGIYKVAIWEGA